MVYNIYFTVSKLPSWFSIKCRSTSLVTVLRFYVAKYFLTRLLQDPYAQSYRDWLRFSGLATTGAALDRSDSMFWAYCCRRTGQTSSVLRLFATSDWNCDSFAKLNDIVAISVLVLWHLGYSTPLFHKYDRWTGQVLIQNAMSISLSFISMHFTLLPLVSSIFRSLSDIAFNILQIYSWHALLNAPTG